MWHVLMIIAVLFCVIKWIKWYISSAALIYYIEKKGYKLPNDKEMEECTAFVTKHLLK